MIDEEIAKSFVEDKEYYRRIVARICDCESDKDEAIAEGFRKAWVARAKYDKSKGTAKGWIGSIIYRTRLDALKYRKRRDSLEKSVAASHDDKPYTLATTLADRAPGPGEEIEHKLAMERVEKLIGKISGTSAALAVELLRNPDVSYEQLSRRLKKPMGTVRSGISRLRKKMGRLADEEWLTNETTFI